jgi:hypothetical protein
MRLGFVVEVRSVNDLSTAYRLLSQGNGSGIAGERAEELQGNAQGKCRGNCEPSKHQQKSQFSDIIITTAAANLMLKLDAGVPEA